MEFKINPNERDLINVFGEAQAKGEGITQELIYCEDIELNGVKVKGDCLYIVSNVVKVGFVSVRPCYEVTHKNGEEQKEYIGEHYRLEETTAELWNTTSNPQGLYELRFKKPIGTTGKKRSYHFIINEKY